MSRRFEPGEVWRDVYTHSDDPVIFLVVSRRDIIGGWRAECVAIEGVWMVNGGASTERTFWDSTYAVDFAEPVAVEDGRWRPL